MFAAAAASRARLAARVLVHTVCSCSPAKRFFNDCLQLADSDRNVDLYHWSSGKFSSAWYDTLSILVAKGRAKIGAAASASDWPKRIRESQYTDHEDYTRGS